MSVSPQSYEAVPFANNIALQQKKNTANYNYVKPKKQKAISQGYVPVSVPVVTTAPITQNYNPMMTMGYPMGYGGPMGMGMGMGPMGMMGPGPGPMGMMGGMGSFGMSPFMGLLGGLFGLGRFF